MHYKILLSAMGSALLIALSAPAQAQFGSAAKIEPYLTLGLGIAMMPDLPSDSFPPLEAEIGTTGSPNLTVGAGIGAVYGKTRHELRFDYRRGIASDITPYLELTGIQAGDPAGEPIDVLTILYQVGLRQPFWKDRMAVYGMIGIGAAYGSIPMGNGLMIEDWEFGYSFNAGLFYDLWKGVGLELGYRYVAATDFTSTFVPDDSFPSSDFSEGQLPFAVHWSSHEILLSVRYAWGSTK
jgi:opacity protein-like surface antigen